MARLTDMVETEVEVNEELEMDAVDAKDALIEALETLIEMVEDDSLNEDEIEILDGAVDFISEDFEDVEDFEEELTEKTLNKMSPAAKMKAKKYRMKNKAKLKAAAKKRKLKDKKLKKKKAKCEAKGMTYSKKKGGCKRKDKRK